MVRTAVDEESVVAHGCGECAGRPVRQGEDHDVMPGKGLRRRVLQHHVAVAREVWVHASQTLTGL